MNERQCRVLQLIIEYFIEYAEPVGSKTLVHAFGLGVSPATIRNDMALLEREGFIRQPHTSAGRIPTEKAYQFYLSHLRQPKAASSALQRMEAELAPSKNVEHALKSMAKYLAKHSKEAVLVAYDKDWSYSAGISHLMAKPDFADMQMLQEVSQAIDQFDEIIDSLFHDILDEPEILIGEANPFGDQMASIHLHYRMPSNHTGFIGILGPMRMNYQRNLALMKSAHEALMNAVYGKGEETA